MSEPNYHTTKFSTENLLAVEITKTQTQMDKHVCLSWSILDLRKTVMYKFWYKYGKTKCWEKTKLSYGSDTFIVYIKTNDIYKDIAEHVEKIFDASNYALDRSLLTGKKKK